MPPHQHPVSGFSRRTALGVSAMAAAAGLFIRVSPAHAEQLSHSEDPYSQLRQRWVDISLGGEAPPDNEDYAAAVAQQDDTALEHLDSMITESGASSPWEDLPLGEDEEDASNMTAAAERLRGIAVCYATPASQLHGDADAADSVAAGVRIVHDSVFHDGQEQYGNWYDWEIGTPLAILDSCVLVADALDDQTRSDIASAVDHFIPDPTRMIDDTLDSTGANRVDLCKAVALRGALLDDGEKLTLASESLAGTLDQVHTGDGFHFDGSFIMHRVIAYPGTYGELMVRGMAELMMLLSGTEWDVADNERGRIAEAIDVSYAPFMHGGLMLDSVRGRSIARTGTRDVDNGFNFAFGLASLADGLADPESTLARRFRSTAKTWLTHNTFRSLSRREPFQIAMAAKVLNDESLPHREDPLGHFAFPDAERITHRREGWLCSLAMNSNRVARFEYMNGENLKGWHTGDGMVQVYLDDDHYQYTDNFWPTVDAKRLPGTTVDTTALEPGSGGDIDNEPLTGSRLSGMVSMAANDGAAAHGLGLAAMELRGHDSPMTAHKTWLFLDIGVVAAGSAISTESGADRSVETIVDNRNLGEPDEAKAAELVIDGQIQPDDLDEVVVHEGVRWAHVADTGGYVFLSHPANDSGSTLSTLRQDRTGSWSDINEGGPDDSVSRRYLTLWHDHGTDPRGARYAHLRLPGASPDATQSCMEDPGVRIVELSADIHAFQVGPRALSSDSASLTAVNFFAPGSAGGITVDAPCAVLVLEDPEDSEPLRVAISDPSRNAAVLRVDISAASHRGAGDIDEKVSVLTTKDGIRLAVEPGGNHGATLRASFGPGTAPQARQLRLLEPSEDATVRAGSSADDNFGNAETLTIWTANDEDDRRAYLKFPLEDVSESSIDRAVLWLRGAIPMDPDDREDEMLQTPVQVYGLTDPDWSENDITWNNAPELGERLGSAWGTVYRDWIGIDVTSAAQAATETLSLAVSQAKAGHELIVDSRESGDAPPILQVVTT